MAKRAKKYSGKLATPRKPWGPLPMLDTDDEITRRKSVDEEEFQERLALLLRHYEIDQHEPTAMPQLLHALLVTHVPGFQRGRGRGKPQRWTAQENVALVSAVETLMDDGMEKADACRRLARSGRFGSNADSLAKRFDEARVAPVVAAIQSLLRATGAKWSELAEIDSKSTREK